MTLRAGYAQADVTPDGGQDLCGFAMRKGRTVGVHDHLMSRSLMLDDGNTRSILNVTDVLGYSRGIATSIRREISKLAEVPASAVNVACTHTHSGPAVAPLNYCGEVDPRYVRRLQCEVPETAARSTVRSRRVAIEVGRVAASENRNRRMKNGPVDRNLIVALLRETDTGKPFAIICNYAAHAVVLGERNLHVSADYPGYLARYLKEKTGAPCLFLNGACGNVNPKVDHQADPKYAREMGERLGSKVIEALEDSTLIESPVISCQSITCELPLYQPKSAAEIERTRKAAVESFRLDSTWFRDHVDAQMRQIRDGKYPRTAQAPFSLMTIGTDFGILFVPGELFTEIGMEIKKRAPLANLMVCCYANGVLGYMPTRKAFEEGGYEALVASFFYGRPAFAADVADAIISAADRLFAKVQA